MKRLAVVLAVAGLGLGMHLSSAGAAGHGLELGIADDSFLDPDPEFRDTWMAKSVDARANLILLNVGWSAIAPTVRPRGFRPADPGDPAYNWAALDGAVRSAVARGMQPVLFVNWAPAWAEGPNRPSLRLAPPGTWMPQPRQLGLFSRALASRYSGRFSDPAAPNAPALPRVRYFEIWGEQNLSVHLNPLWRGGNLFAPRHYRAMLNTAYEEIHAVNASAKVIVGGLSPYGDLDPRDGRIPPVLFWRSFLCLRGAELVPVGCRDPAHFDIASHNPINVGGPETSALSPLDVSTPDIGRIIRVVRRAVQTGGALPARPKPFWATEIWWDSKPPDPRGVPARRHARFVTKSLFTLWRQGASAVIWWYLRDQSHATGFGATQQSGLFLRDGRPKLAYRAFRFPFIAGRGRDGGLFVWGKAPSPGALVVERKVAGGWTPLAQPAARSTGIFLARVDSASGVTVRARQGDQTSLPWRVR